MANARNIDCRDTDRSENRRTVLSIAAQNGNLDDVVKLINDGEDINMEDNFWMRPIHYAAAYGRTEVFTMLAEQSKMNVNNSKWNCLDLAIDNNHPEIVLAILRSKTLQWEEMLRTKTWTDSDSFNDTPMRKLIRKMPEVAREVFNKCTEIGGSQNEFKVVFKYKYLDDTNHLYGWKKNFHTFIASEDADSDKVRCKECYPCQCIHRLPTKKGGKIKTGCQYCDGSRFYEESKCCEDCRTFIFPCQTAESQERKGGPYSNDRNHIKENHPLMIMVKSKRNELLDHPLVSALLKKKWSSIGLIFSIVNCLVYAVFLALLTGFTLSLPAPYQLKNILPSNISECQNISSLPSNISECQKVTDEAEPISGFASFVIFGIILLASIELIIEIAEWKQMYSFKLWNYFTKLENIFEWITCISAMVFVVNTNEGHDTGLRTQEQWWCGTISVFLAWINMLSILQKFEWIGIYVVMLYRIVKMFTRFFLVFSLLIVAFAIAFYCLLQNQDQFSSIPLSFVKTTSMMTGEIDFGTTFFEEHVNFVLITFAFFYIFVLFMTIVVINLLIGLAVNNIQEFKKDADLSKKKMQVEFALELERLSTSTLLIKIFNFFSSKYKKYISQDETDENVATFSKEESRVEVENTNQQTIQKQNDCMETFYPNNLGWLEEKFAESWKLTESDIKSGLQNEQDETTRNIAQLERKIGTLESHLKTQLDKIMHKLDFDLTV